jgi:Putative addiction module component
MYERVKHITDQARQLSPKERAAPIDALWVTRPTHTSAPPISVWHLDELDRRIVAEVFTQEYVVPWDEASARSQARAPW